VEVTGGYSDYPTPSNDFPPGDVLRAARFWTAALSHLDAPKSRAQVGSSRNDQGSGAFSWGVGDGLELEVS